MCGTLKHGCFHTAVFLSDCKCTAGFFHDSKNRDSKNITNFVKKLLTFVPKNSIIYKRLAESRLHI